MRQLLAVVAIAGLLTSPAAATAAYEGALPSVLEVSTTSHFEPIVTSQPGSTALHVKTTAGWHVTVTVRVHGATVLVDEPEGTDSVVKQGTELAPGPTATHETVVFWSCKRPGTVYSYEVSAGYGEEPPLTKTGSFTGATQKQCEEALRLYVRKHGQQVHRQQAKARRERGEELARQRRFERNCRIVGGRPVTIQTNRGPEIVCRSQTGGIVEA